MKVRNVLLGEVLDGALCLSPAGSAVLAIDSSH
jgi:hypothetical protein